MFYDVIFFSDLMVYICVKWVFFCSWIFFLNCCVVVIVVLSVVICSEIVWFVLFWNILVIVVYYGVDIFVFWLFDFVVVCEIYDFVGDENWIVFLGMFELCKNFLVFVGVYVVLLCEVIYVFLVLILVGGVGWDYDLDVVV